MSVDALGATKAGILGNGLHHSLLTAVTYIASGWRGFGKVQVSFESAFMID